MKEIKYIGFYDLPNPKTKRVSALSATNKMDYICDAINKAGFKVHLISPSWTDDSAKNSKFQKTSTYQLKENKKLTVVASFGTSNKITRNIKILYSLLWLLFWLLKNVKKGEKIIVYHSPWIALPIIIAKKIKRFRIILEVEEIYGKVWEIKSILNLCEKLIINNADSYIVVSEVLKDRLPKKDTIILYGSYNVPTLTKENILNNNVNIVYSGTIDKINLSAFKIIECINLLPNNYYINILGFGDELVLEELNILINNKNIELGREACVFHGVKLGKDFSSFLNSCDIAVNPQIEGEYMTTAFPSKILTYLSHNLPVVSTNIESIKKSSLAEIIYFTQDDSALSISKEIEKIDIKEKYDYSKILQELHHSFVEIIKIKLN